MEVCIIRFSKLLNVRMQVNDNDTHAYGGIIKSTVYFCMSQFKVSGRFYKYLHEF